MLLCPRFIVLIIELADCHQPQAETNHYQELIPGVTEDPYHVTVDVISAIKNVCYCMAGNISRELLLMNFWSVTKSQL